MNSLITCHDDHSYYCLFFKNVAKITFCYYLFSTSMKTFLRSLSRPFSEKQLNIPTGVQCNIFPLACRRRIPWNLFIYIRRLVSRTDDNHNNRKRSMPVEEHRRTACSPGGVSAHEPGRTNGRTVVRG